MSNWNDLNQASAALNDPGLPAAELMAIAAAQPSLWPRVAKHPAVYPGLLDWLRDRGAAIAPEPPSAGKGPDAAPSAQSQTPPDGPPQRTQDPVLHAQGTPFAAGPPPGGPPPAQQPTQAWGGPYAPSPAPPPSEQYQTRQEWAIPAPPPNSQAEPPAGWGQPPTTKTKPKRAGLVVGIVVAAVVVLSGTGVGIWALTHRGDKPTAPPSAQAESPRGRQTPSADPSKTEPAGSQPAQSPTTEVGGQGGSISLTTGADPVTYAAGETPFQGTAEMSGVDSTQVGFIMAADGASIRQITLRFEGGKLPTEFNFTALTHSYSADYDITDGEVTADLGEGAIVLKLTFDGDKATGTLAFSDEVDDIETDETKTLDLGVGEVHVTATG